MVNPLKAIYRRLVIQGQEAAAKEFAVEILEDQTALAARTAKAAGEILDLADKFEEGGNPHKRRVAELLRTGLIRTLETMEGVATGQTTPEEGGKTGQALPLSSGSNSSNGSLHGSTPNALESPQKPLPKKRGRPHKDKSGSPPETKS